MIHVIYQFYIVNSMTILKIFKLSTKLLPIVLYFSLLKDWYTSTIISINRNLLLLFPELFLHLCGEDSYQNCSIQSHEIAHETSQVTWFSCPNLILWRRLRCPFQTYLLLLGLSPWQLQIHNTITGYALLT